MGLLEAERQLYSAGDDGIEQPGKTLVKIGAAKRDYTVGAAHLHPDNASFSQLGKVIADVRLGGEIEKVAAVHVDVLVAGEIADNRRTRLVAERGDPE